MSTMSNMSIPYNNVLVCGLARSGVSAALLLLSKGINVTVSDSKKESDIKEIATKLKNAGATLCLSQNPDNIIENFDLIVISPGIPIDTRFIVLAKEKNIKVISEIELSYLFCKAPIIAITGTNGKTTTTTLTGQIFKNYNEKTFVVGNIGLPFSEKVLEAGVDSFIVAEISSFQMEAVQTFKPFISCVLNITPDHLNRHYTMENYIDLKEKVFALQSEDDFTVLNFDDQTVQNMQTSKNLNKSKIIFFSQKTELQEGAFLIGDEIYTKFENQTTKIVNIKDLKVFGTHLIEDVLAAVTIATCAKIPTEIITKTLLDFSAVEHRIEFVDNINGVDYYNDSKATNTDATLKALDAMKKNIVLIAGGQSKNADYSDIIKNFHQKIKYLILIGETADDFITVCKNNNFTNYKKVETLKEAVNLAKTIAKKEDCVLLSPACASLDMFESYEQRGNMFKTFVKMLKN